MLAAMEHELEYLDVRGAPLMARLHEQEPQTIRSAAALAEAMRENAEMKFGLEETRRRVALLVERLPKEEEA